MVPNKLLQNDRLLVSTDKIWNDIEEKGIFKLKKCKKVNNLPLAVFGTSLSNFLLIEYYKLCINWYFDLMSIISISYNINST